jgi:hypothetical protein
MKCARCNRPLKNLSPNGYGPKCAAAVLGVLPARARRASKAPDERQTVLFTEVRP